MYCGFCGKGIPDDSTFCSYCGHSLSVEVKRVTNDELEIIEAPDKSEETATSLVKKSKQKFWRSRLFGIASAIVLIVVGVTTAWLCQ